MSDPEEQTEEQTPPEPVREPMVHPGLLREVLERLGEIDQNLETLETHVKTKVDQYAFIMQEIMALAERVERVERKTFSLADRPGQMNCPSCGRKIASPQTGKCSICGYILPR